MNKQTILCAVASAAMTFGGCASTTWNSYPGGTIKSSVVSYNYTALPVLKEGARTYKIEADTALAAIRSVGALDAKGVTRSEGPANVVFSIQAGAATHEPGGFGLGSKFKPALISRLPVAIKVLDGSGNLVLERTVQHEEVLVMNGATEFKTRDEAKAAMAKITDLSRSSADLKLRQGAPAAVGQTLDLLAKELFEPRKVTVALPAIRSAGDLDMEQAYNALAEARGDAQVKGALAAYAALGTEHKKADGSPDLVANYGVRCGLAAAKVLAGDLSGAWQDTKAAGELMPEGKEHRQIAKVLLEQQEKAGVTIIPKEELDAMVSAEKAQTMNQLQNLFGGKK